MEVDTTNICQLYRVDECQDTTHCDDDSITSKNLTERVNSHLFIVRETESGEEIWRLPIQNADAVANHIIANDKLRYRLPSHTFRSMLLPMDGQTPIQSATWIASCAKGLFFAAFHEFDQRDDATMNSPFRFPEFTYCWFSDGENHSSNNDEDKWAFYHGLKLMSLEDALCWIVYRLMDDVQGEHFTSFLFQALGVLKKHLGALWEEQLGFCSQKETVSNMLMYEKRLQSLGCSLETPSSQISLSTEVARAAINELFYGERFKSSATVEDLHQQLKDVAVKSSIDFFSLVEMIMKAYTVHMQKQFTLIRLMFGTSSTGTLTDYYNEPKEDHPRSSSDLIGFRELHKILKTLWPKITMQESTLIYREAYDVMYPQSDWGRPSPNGISFDSFMIAADHRSLFSQMRA
ncbi:hypothetical protein ACHAXN_011120 [Cyclotella atomus]